MEGECIPSSMAAKFYICLELDDRVMKAASARDRHLVKLNTFFHFFSLPILPSVRANYSPYSLTL